MKTDYFGSLYRLYGPDMLMHFMDIGKKPPLFADAANVALEVLKCGFEYDVGQLYHNIFRWVPFRYRLAVSKLNTHAMLEL